MATGGSGPCAAEKVLPHISQHCRKSLFQFSFLGQNITVAASQCLEVLGRAAIFFPLLAANPVREHLHLLWTSLGQEMSRDSAPCGQADVGT